MLNKFFNYHIYFQKGTYINNEICLDELTFYHSNVIQDSDWNFFRILESTQKLDNSIFRLISISTLLNREPVVLIEKGSNLYNKLAKTNQLEETLEYWMCAYQKDISILNRPAIVSDIKIFKDPKPSNDFLEVFGSLFSNVDINQHFKDYYNVALHSATIQNDCEVQHIVAYDKEKPIACASVYLKDEIIGLYNVGTVFNYQNKGLGKWISSFACHSFGTNNEFEVFLQCVVDGHVPKMYSELGFKVASTNAQLKFKN